MTPDQDDAARENPLDSAGEQPGDWVGRYKLVESIGEGGMGTVWKAEQHEPVRRKVALKLIKVGLDTKQVIARFEAERQALALMDHPNIASVLDAGATPEGRPFFVMEYIQGVPVVEFCNQQETTTRARLLLFQQICQAIQHAHQKGIIHRDIKPSNVLVAMHDGAPAPIVIDFGIAKAVDTELTTMTLMTEHQQIVGTPAYMSPEQSEMSGLDIDTRSDIYSLGVLLYELLTGTTPFDINQLLQSGFLEMMRVIQEVDPERPSTRVSSLGEVGSDTASRQQSTSRELTSVLRGDLDWIVMKCLEKERSRRYESASALAADLQRHLDDEPVEACPPSTGYRMRKFVRRNRTAVIAGGALTVTLLVGLVGTIYGLVEAKRQGMLAEERLGEAKLAREAETERAEELEQVAGYLSTQFALIAPVELGSALRKSILESVPEAERAEFEEQLSKINFTGIGLNALQANLFEPSFESIGEEFAEQPLVEAKLLQAMATTVGRLGLPHAAEEAQERALMIRRRELGEDHPTTFQSLWERGALSRLQGNLRAAEAELRSASAGLRDVNGAEHRSTIGALISLGVLLQNKGELEEAEECFRDALEASRRALGPDAPSTLNAMGNLGFVLMSQGESEEAEEFLRDTLDGRRRVLGPDHRDTLVSMASLAAYLLSAGRIEEADPIYHETLEARRRVLGNEHTETISSIGNLALLYKNQGRIADAEALCREAVDRSVAALGVHHQTTAASYENLALCLEEQGRFEEAVPLYEQALIGVRSALGSDSSLAGELVENIILLLLVLDEQERAIPYVREALERTLSNNGGSDLETQLARNRLGSVLLSTSNAEEAEPILRTARDHARAVEGDDAPITLIISSNLGLALNALGRFDEAEPLLRGVLPRFAHAFGEDSWQRAETEGRLGECLSGQGRLDEADAYLLESYSALESRVEEVIRVRVLRRAANRLVRHYEAAGNDEAAESWRAQVRGLTQ